MCLDWEIGKPLAHWLGKEGKFKLTVSEVKEGISMKTLQALKGSSENTRANSRSIYSTILT